MDRSNKPPQDIPDARLIDGVIKMVAVWGAAIMVGDGINYLLSDILSRGWRLSLFIVSVLVVVGAILPGGELWPRLRNFIFAWQSPIAMLVAVYVGYQWHAYEYAHSREGHFNKATRWACERNIGCKKAANDYYETYHYDD